MKLNVIELSHIAISCNSLEESVHFYKEIFGFKESSSLVSNKGNVKLVIGSNTYIELFPFTMYKSKGRGCISHFAIRVNSIDDSIRLLGEKGLEILRGPFEVKDKNNKVLIKVVFYAGPSGEEIELLEHLKS